MKTRPLEPIYAALFARMASLVTDGVLKTASRRLQHVNDYPLENMPAGFQNQTPIRVSSAKTGLPKNYLGVDWYFYVPGGMEIVQSIALNACIDSSVSKLAPPVGGKQTLGGLAEDCYIEGNIEIYEGVLQDRAVAVLPIVIVVPGF